MMPAQRRTSPYSPLALRAATPLANSVSPDRPHRRRAVRARHRGRFDIDGLADVVPGLRIGQQFLEHVVQVRPVIEMVVRVDDRQCRLERRFLQIAHGVACCTKAFV
ncbi:MAG: hypothetical protein WDN49_18285 [Acetobacteraceae bacterium]